MLESSGVVCDIDTLVGRVAKDTRVALNFHPDRLARDGRMVAEAMLEDGIYRSQFESGISNGGLTAFPGGDRDRWEEQLFGGAYQRAGVASHERPKYGGLNLMSHPDGPCPRFGSCHLRLRQDVVDRTTFTFGDTYTSPADAGTMDAFEPVLAGLFEATSSTRVSLGRPGMTVEALIATIERTPGDVAAVQGRALDDYIEAQVHGGVAVGRDAEAVVADPSFRATGVGDVLEEIARRYGLELTWHAGFELEVGEIDAEFRGPAIPVLAARIVRDLGPGSGSGRLDAELVGRAARSVVTTPGDWLDLGSPPEVLQYVKQLWHVLVHLGSPAGGDGA